jgi:hypothetical protein
MRLALLDKKHFIIRKLSHVFCLRRRGAETSKPHMLALINFLFSNMNTYTRIMLHKKLPFCLNWIRGFFFAACEHALVESGEKIRRSFNTQTYK